MMNRTRLFGVARSVSTAVEQEPLLVAALWMLAAGALLSACGVFIRFSADELHPFQIAFFRNLFGLVVVLPWLVRNGLGQLKTSHYGLYALRAGSSLLSMLTFFYAVTVLPLMTVMAVDFTTPVFAAIFAVLLLRERLTFDRVITIFGCFLGVIFIARPNIGSFDWNILVILASAISGGVTILLVKILARTESPEQIVAHFVLLLIPLSAIPALWVWRWPSIELLPWIVLLGIFGTLAHNFSTRAFAMADAAALSPFEYVRLVFAGVIGFVVFAEVPSWTTVLGSLVIVVSVGRYLRREFRA